MKYLFFLFSAFIFGQIQSIDYTNNLPKTTTPLTVGDKNKIKDVVNNNATILGQLDAQIDLLHGSGIRTIQKVVGANLTLPFFSITNPNGILSIDAKIISEGAGFYLIKNIDITFVKGTKGLFINQSEGNPAHDFDIILTNITSGSDIIGYSLSVQNLSSSLGATFTITLTIGGSLSPITFINL